MTERSVATRRWASRAARLGFALGGVALVGACFRELRLGELARLLGSLGPLVLVVFVPVLLALFAESLGWKFSLGAIGTKVALWPLFLVRGATEALATFLPGGALVGESAKPVLLERLAGLPVPLGVSTTAYRKYLRVLSHGLFLVVVSVVGASTLRAWSGRALGNGVAPWALGGLGGALVVLSLASLVSLRSGRVAERVHGLARRALPERLQPWLDGRRDSFHATDESTRSLFSLPFRVSGIPLGLCLGAWFLESLEAYVLLRLLGQNVSFEAVLAIDVGVSLLRQLLVVLPGGLGVQEVGYLSGLGLLGLPEPTLVAGAFVCLKRGRELVQGGLFLLVFGLGSRRAV